MGKKVGLILGVLALLLVCLLPAKGFSAEDLSDAEYVGSSTCAACHEPQMREFKLSPHARIDVGEDEGVPQGCEMCHGAGSKHVDEGGGRGTMPSVRDNPDLCYNCHIEKKAQFRLPYRHPVEEGHMSCADCHNSHGPDTSPSSSLSLEGPNATCFKCHTEQRGPFVFEHEALREGCSTCHKVHGSITDKMLVARDANLCFRCHTQADYPNVGNSGHNTRFPDGPCFSAGTFFG